MLRSEILRFCNRKKLLKKKIILFASKLFVRYSSYNSVTTEFRGSCIVHKQIPISMVEPSTKQNCFNIYVIN